MSMRLVPAGHPEAWRPFDPQDSYRALLELSREGNLTFNLEEVVREIVEYFKQGALE